MRTFINEEIVKKSREIGLNLSQYCENALKEAIERLEGLKAENKSSNDPKTSGWDSNLIHIFT